jgi:hypothetical protein
MLAPRTRRQSDADIVAESCSDDAFLTRSGGSRPAVSPRHQYSICYELVVVFPAFCMKISHILTKRHYCSSEQCGRSRVRKPPALRNRNVWTFDHFRIVARSGAGTRFSFHLFRGGGQNGGQWWFQSDARSVLRPTDSSSAQTDSSRLIP